MVEKVIMSHQNLIDRRATHHEELHVYLVNLSHKAIDRSIKTLHDTHAKIDDRSVLHKAVLQSAIDGHHFMKKSLTHTSRARK